MNIALFHSVWTVLLLILFVGIVLWAYSSRRRQHFDAAARLPLEDEDSLSLPLSPGGRGQGERGKPSIPAHGEKHHG